MTHIQRDTCLEGAGGIATIATIATTHAPAARTFPGYDPFDVLVRSLRTAAEVRLLRAAAAGCVDSGVDLVQNSALCRRGAIVHALYYADAPPEVLRGVLRFAWLTAYLYVVSALTWEEGRGPSVFEDAFRHAAFPVPADMPDELVVFRGQKVSLRGRPAFAHTTSRAAACWWAFRIADAPYKLPTQLGTVVLRRVIRKADVLFYEPPGFHPHDQICVTLPPGAGEVDGDPEEWAGLARAFRRMAERTPTFGGTGPYFEPQPYAPKLAGSLADQYADQANRAQIGADLAADLRRELEPGAVASLNHALEGRTGGAAPVNLAEGHMKGAVALAMYLAGVAPDALRDALVAAWSDAPGSVVEATAPYGPRCMVDMFRAAQFAMPAEWGDTVTVYRGDRGGSIAEAQASPSWTDQYDVACFRAVKVLGGHGVKGEPLVLRREVPRSCVLAYLGDPGRPVVVLDAPPGGELCGTPSEWAAASARLAYGLVPDELRREARAAERAKPPHALSLARHGTS